MKKQFILAIVGAFIVGQSWSQETPSKIPDKALVKSRVLEAEFIKLMKEQIKKERPQLAPHIDEFAQVAIGKMRKQVPAFLRVTKDKEEKLARGEFDEKGAKQRIEAQIKKAKEAKVEVPEAASKFIDDFERGELKGVSLELAAHLCEVLIDAKIQGESAKKGKGSKKRKTTKRR